jgi:hypothetical protein
VVTAVMAVMAVMVAAEAAVTAKCIAKAPQLPTPRRPIRKEDMLPG